MLDIPDLLDKTIAVFKRLDDNGYVAWSRYALNRAIDVFVIGPATIGVFCLVLGWAAGHSVFEKIAIGTTPDAGEGRTETPRYCERVRTGASGRFG
jgi:hypothetical protein